MKIQLTGKKGGIAIVDAKWYKLIPELQGSGWYKNASGYACKSIWDGKKNITIYMSRLIFERIHGPIPYKMQVEHRDTDKLTNTRRNLRLATDAQNKCNIDKVRKNTTSSFKGVARVSRGNKYCAYGQLNGHKVWLGTFDKELRAAKAYNSFARKHYHLFKRLNDTTRRA